MSVLLLRVVHGAGRFIACCRASLRCLATLLTPRLYSAANLDASGLPYREHMFRYNSLTPPSLRLQFGDSTTQRVPKRHPDGIPVDPTARHGHVGVVLGATKTAVTSSGKSATITVAGDTVPIAVVLEAMQPMAAEQLVHFDGLDGFTVQLDDAAVEEKLRGILTPGCTPRQGC
jgi:hypothetical protein